MVSKEAISFHSRAISPDEVSFHPHSFGDSDGRLFWWKGNLYRGITPEKTPLFERLFSDGIIQSLVASGLLIETEPADLGVEGYGMVVGHRPVPFVSYPNEWCAAMLKDASVTIINLLMRLMESGLTLKDAHPWNLLFDGTNPVFVDLTSIIETRDDFAWPAYDEFCRFCFYPLILMCHGQERIARCLLPEYEGVRRADLSVLAARYRLSPFILSKLMRRGLRPVQSLFRKRAASRKDQLDFLKRIRRDLESLPLSNGGEDSGPSSSNRNDRAAVERRLFDILSELRPRTVLALGGETMICSKLAARLGSSVVSFSRDSMTATRLYSYGSAKGLPILPLIMDFIKPTPSVGYKSHYLISATDRFKCDMVVASGLVYESVFERNLNFDLIAEGLSLFSRRWLLVEFARPELPPAEMQNFSWYTLDNFAAALRQRFPSVKVLPTEAEGGRWLLCEK